MSEDDSQGREGNVGKRIASLMQSIGQGLGKQISDEERQKLKAAAGRLDQMLKDVADGDRQALRDAADKLDRLLVDIRKGNDVAGKIKRRNQAQPGP